MWKIQRVEGGGVFQLQEALENSNILRNAETKIVRKFFKYAQMLL